jgi:hypothetical protein
MPVSQYGKAVSGLAKLSARWLSIRRNLLLQCGNSLYKSTERFSRVYNVQEGRDSAVDAVKAAYWTGAGICAHESAMKDGAKVLIPDFQAYYKSL